MITKHTDESNAKILIVDDKLENLRLLARILKEKGYVVRQLREGKMVMSSVLSNPPDLILLDIVMPETDGYEVCRQLKAEERTCDIPVIFISALNDMPDKVRAFFVGGVDYVTKPFQEEEVLARVETHLTLRRLQKALEEKNARLEEKNLQLEEALANVRTLRGLLPICANCKRIRDDKGYWNRIEAYVESHSDARFSHGLCEECSDKLYGDQEWYRKARKNIIK
ncbi:response regulator [Desulfobacterales bacterium HSG2]|nr:response regulator [Desulfobacterales bacterium HSG2]